ncbi:hypothetical protein MWU57_09730 [Isoptericola sp. S6320L]|uniref:hypothetical protein n=1 Tax=Isoptericola sp. S6320L TaxID=2926411 RepID=UPI001FF2E47E|nr:hypothetical protein [Isoptericola sp. S6320L]MCK0117313.1 hypothetical protein [Isoptericola sp. S6320L]
MFSMGLSGLVMVILQVLLPLATAVAVVVIAVTMVRGGSPARAAGAPTDRPGLLEQRLHHLDRLHDAGRITDDERAEARARLLGTL